MTKRFPPRRILVPIDFSPASRSALRAAMALAARFKAQLKLIHVHEIEPVPAGPEAAGAVLALAAMHRNDPGLLKRTRRRLLALAAGFRGPVTARSFFGVPAHALPRLSCPACADMVVMGTHGSKGLRRALRGSVAEAVMRRGKLPVLAIRSRRRPVGLRRLLCPFNLEDYSVPALRYAARLARALGAELTVLYVQPPGLWEEDAKLRLAHEVKRALNKDADGLALRLIKDSKPLDALARRLRREGFDLVLIAEHARFWQRLIGTTAERLLRRSVVPILAVPSLRAAKPAA
jgi:nucleotide-binding universal stress UspA family protein